MRRCRCRSRGGGGLLGRDWAALCSTNFRSGRPRRDLRSAMECLCAACHFGQHFCMPTLHSGYDTRSAQGFRSCGYCIQHRVCTRVFHTYLPLHGVCILQGLAFFPEPFAGIRVLHTVRHRRVFAVLGRTRAPTTSHGSLIASRFLTAITTAMFDAIAYEASPAVASGTLSSTIRLFARLLGMCGAEHLKLHAIDDASLAVATKFLTPVATSMLCAATFNSCSPGTV